MYCRIKNLALLVSIAFFVSCGGTENPSYAFKNQNLQGSIEGSAWTFASGTAEDSGFTSGALSIRFSETSYSNPCNEFVLEGNSVFSSVPKEVGLYELSLNFETGDGRTATLFDESEFQNVIATEGAIEILTITSTEVTGRMDIRADSDNFANGSFTIPLCE